jgi:hypothetical protein
MPAAAAAWLRRQPLRLAQIRSVREGHCPLSLSLVVLPSISHRRNSRCYAEGTGEVALAAEAQGEGDFGDVNAFFTKHDY